jgi:hypothetical protein
VVHDTGKGLYAHAKGRPDGERKLQLNCPEILVEKLIELRKDFGLHDDTQMLVMLSISTKDMNRYVSMYPEVWFIDCTAGESY